jgi:hypothetical protein
MNIQLQNRTNAGVLFAYITGLALDNSNHVTLIKSDGKTPYYPANPSQIGTKLSEDCAIKLGPQGSTTTVTIPSLAGGRIWFSINKELTFLLNPGPAIVEPSVTNPSDPNINIEWDFCEFTFANNQLYANISYVDFASLSISLELTPTNGAVQKVAGLKPDGLNSIVAGLQRSNLPFADDWKKCIYAPGGKVLRILSPNGARFLGGQDMFKGYYDPYVNAVWEKYSHAPLTIDTHAQWGRVSAKISNDALDFPGIGTFAKPSSQDIFSCSTGPFASNAEALGPLTARITAGLNRSTLLKDGLHPDEVEVADYYKESITNHYSRLVHEANLDGRGYAFPYDDVPGKGVDQSGFVNGDPKDFVVSIG